MQAGIFIEDRDLLFGRDALAVIADTYEALIALQAVFDFNYWLDNRIAGLAAAELEGVVQYQPNGAAAEHRIGYQVVRLACGGDLDLALGFERTETRQAVADHLAETSAFEARPHGVGLELGHVKDISDEVVEAEGLGQGRADQRLALFLAQLVIKHGHDLQRTDDGGQRRFQVVRYRRQHLAMQILADLVMCGGGYVFGLHGRSYQQYTGSANRLNRYAKPVRKEREQGAALAHFRDRSHGTRGKLRLRQW